MVTKKQLENIVAAAPDKNFVRREARDLIEAVNTKEFNKELNFFNTKTKLNIKSSDILGGYIFIYRSLLTKTLSVSNFFMKDSFLSYKNNDAKGENILVIKYADIQKVERYRNDTMKVRIVMKDGKEYSRQVAQGDLVAYVLGEIAKLNGGGDIEVKSEEPKKEKKTTKQTEPKEKAPVEKKEKAPVEKKTKATEPKAPAKKKVEPVVEEKIPVAVAVEEPIVMEEPSVEVAEPEIIKAPAKELHPVVSHKGFMVINRFPLDDKDRDKVYRYIKDKGLEYVLVERQKFCDIIEDSEYEDSKLYGEGEYVEGLAIEKEEDINEFLIFNITNSIPILIYYLKFDGKLYDIDQIYGDLRKEFERSSKNRVEEIDDMIDWSKALFKYRSLNDESKIKIFAKVRDSFGPFFDNSWVISGFDKLKPDENINDANKYIERNRVLAYIDVVMDAYIDEEMILDGQEIALEFGIKEPVKMSEEEIRAHDRVNGRKQFVNYTKHRIHRLDDLYKPHNGNNSIYSKRSKSILGGSARSHAVSVIDGHKGYGVIDYKNASKASKDDMINVATNEIGITFFKEDQIPDTYVLKDVFKDTEYGFLTGPCNVSGVDLRYLFAFETIEEFLEFYYDVRTKNPSCRILAAGIEGKEIDFAQLKLMGE